MDKYVATWSPLTGEPEMLSQLMYDLGAERSVVLNDVFDLDNGLNDAVALIIIYPESKDDERRKDVEENQRVHAGSASTGIPSFIRQNIDNACGMIAIVNAVLNSPARALIKDGSILHGIAQRGTIEITDEILSVYDRAVVEDDLDSSTEHHFTVLVQVPIEEAGVFVGTHLVELDGERQSPFIRASSRGDSLRDTSLVRGAFDMLRNGTTSAAIYKLTLVGN